MPSNKYIHIGRDLGLIAISIFVAINLVETQAIEKIIGHSTQLGLLSAFVAGVFFTSIFTAAPATVALYEIAQTSPILLVASLGALGAMIGDMLIFRIIKDTLMEDVASFFSARSKERFGNIIRVSYLRWLSTFVGGMIIASPLPDELGLALMGISKIDQQQFAATSLVFNFLGILIIGLIAS